MVKINRKWAVVTCLMALLIWGNSLVPGSGSGSLSLTVMEAIRGFLRGVGLPYAWVTNFVVRKCAHFTEYMVLGILATHAFDYEGRRTFDVLLPTAVFLLLLYLLRSILLPFVAGMAVAYFLDPLVQRMIRAGVPATIAKSGTSFVTVASAATIAFSPIVTPGRIVAPAPTQAFRFR